MLIWLDCDKFLLHHGFEFGLSPVLNVHSCSLLVFSFARCACMAACVLQVLRLSEELVSRGVLDDACLAVIGRGCTALQALELVQVRG